MAAGSTARPMAIQEDGPAPGQYAVGNRGVQVLRSPNAALPQLACVNVKCALAEVVCVLQIVNCGMHSISVSPCESLLASGGSNPSDCQIFRILRARSGSVRLEPSQTLVVRPQLHVSSSHSRLPSWR